MSASSCNAMEATITSIKIRRYFITTGINQLKSKRASLPKTELREAMEIGNFPIFSFP